MGHSLMDVMNDLPSSSIFIIITIFSLLFPFLTTLPDNVKNANRYPGRDKRKEKGKFRS